MIRRPVGTWLMMIFIFCILAGCHPLFCFWNMGYTQITIEPSKQEVVGKYVLAEKSLKYLESRGFRKLDYELHLKENGEFQFINAPDIVLNSWGTTGGVVDNRQGKWSVSCADTYDCLIELDGICVVPLTRGKGKMAIPITIGDGDECNGIIYEKR